eukprot:CAMPEP_0181255340 /NCGR_PEP_ID=MMETSP1096-20121128/49096_1 /TAXON_ID=156174 ORGANISM="Chrysochromulina ericina, Strain CCMP281" /NCGR_SAMPLE_ID=MMETSP1096 /ASSEMBLY_ACC=CAM_ASM_000453 /LENGTH=331 /DNA_ID=CAMNT_0023353459 /DNA_START=529 /DNA_END=1522 /DNA_ORIENTATION=-
MWGTCEQAASSMMLSPKRASDVDRLQGDISLSTRRRPAKPQWLAAAWAGLQTGKGGEAPPRPTSCALEELKQPPDEIIEVPPSPQSTVGLKVTLFVLGALTTDDLAQSGLRADKVLRVPIHRAIRPLEASMTKRLLTAPEHCVAKETAGKCAEDSFHEREVFNLVVSAEEDSSCPKLDKDAPPPTTDPHSDPNQGQVSPQEDGTAVCTRRLNGAETPIGAAKVDESDRVILWWLTLARRGRDEEHILRLQVGVRQLDLVQMGQRLEAITCDNRNLLEGEVCAGRTAPAASLQRAPDVAQPVVERRAHRLEDEAVVTSRFEAAQQPYDRERA